MNYAQTASSLRNRRWSPLILAWLIGLAALVPVVAQAAVSLYCPTRSANVAWGGAATIDVTTCDGSFDGGMSGPIAPFAQHGTVTIGANDLPGQTITYAHNGLTGTTDTFALEDNDLGVVTVTITIAPPASTIVVSPGALPALGAGAPFSQTLTSSGGTGPYTYSLASGSLPAGLALTPSGVLSGTPTQRGPYSFSVRSQDSLGAFAVHAYAGVVQNPALSIAPASATAIQSVAFSQSLTASGGVAPRTFLLESGSLPAGITITSGGVLSGTTSVAAGNYPVTLRVTDSSTGPGSYFELESFTLTVSPPPSVSISVSPAAVSEDGATNLVFTVTRSLNLSSSTVVNLTTTGTATAGSDYTGAVATVTIPAGSTSATVVIDPTADSTVEPDETVTISVAAGTGYTVGAPSSATGTILNDDVPTATISVSPAAVAEDGAANLVYTVTLSQASLSAVSVNFTIGGTATSGVDYAAVTSPLVIPAGSTTGTIVIDPTADATVEGDETVIITLTAGSGYTVGNPSSATGTILNDDLPTLTINDVTVAEGNSGTTNATFTVSLSQPAGPGGVTFDIATANGTAVAGVDYLANSLVGQTIPAGSSTYAFTVQVIGDTQNELNETFFVNVTNVVNAVVGDGQGLGTILNDDPLPQLSVNDVTVAERNGATTSAVFTASLDAASGQTVTVNYATADGTATAPGDYTATSGTLTFPPGTTTRTLTVTVNGDLAIEGSETFSVVLSGAVNATIARATGVGTIVDFFDAKQSVTTPGKSDIFYQHTDGRTHGWAVNGGTLLGNSFLTSLGSSFRVKGIGDFNGDGPDDLLLRDGAGFNKIVRLGPNGNLMTVLGAHDIVPAGLNWEIAAVGDFDGDGRDDILWRDVGGYNFMYFAFNQATSGVTQSAVAGLGIDWKVAGVADFDGDGKADIFWRNINGANALWLMNGPAVKQVLNFAGLGNDWSVAGVADYNRDGKPDILWRNIAGYNGIWFMNNNVVAQVVNVPGVTPDWRIVGTGDYNGDGYADILWEQTVNGTRVVWLMQGGVYQGEAVLPGTGDNISWQVVNPASTR